MRVRISFDALRLCLLVAAGVTSGYLWRAAFESSSPAEERIAATPRIVEQTPAPPVVRIAPHHLTTPKRSVPVKHVAGGPAVRHGPATLITSHTTASSSLPPHTTPSPTAPPTSNPTPTPPKPSPAPTPAPAPTPPAPTTTTAPSVASPPVQAAATPTPASPPSSQPNLGASQDDDRPGWGKGDENHDHSGPGGKGK
jgi:hypothetical protein